MKIYSLENQFLRASILSTGATLQNLEVKKEDGTWQRVVLSLEEVEDYQKKNLAYLGTTVGRIAGRVEEAKLPIGERIYELEKNHGRHHIHGGEKALSHKEWRGKQEGSCLCLEVESPDMENGYPGSLQIKASFCLQEQSLELRYEVQSDRETYCNFTNHSYFSLSGGKDISKETLRLNADYYMPVNEETLPLGVESVEGSLFDFRSPKVLSEIFSSQEEELQRVGGGLDHPFLATQAILEDEETGLGLEVESNRHAMVLYTGNFLEEAGLLKHSGICFECQDIPNVWKWRPEDYRIGRNFTTEIRYRFYHLKRERK